MKRYERNRRDIAFHRKDNLKEVMDVGKSKSSEDILVVRVECMNRHEKPERMNIVVFMTVEGERAARENRGK